MMVIIVIHILQLLLSKGGQAATWIGILLKINAMVSDYDVNHENECEAVELSLHQKQ